MRPRFSLRWLLFLTALVAVACYWWIARPTIVAKRFCDAIAAHDYEAADRLCLDPNRRFVNRAVVEFRAGRSLARFPIGSTTALPPDPITVDVHVVRRTWQDLLRGQRRLKMAMNFDVTEGTVLTSAGDYLSGFGLWPMQLDLLATAGAIHPPPDELPTYAGHIVLPIP